MAMMVFVTDTEGMLYSDGEGNVGFVSSTHHAEFTLCMLTTF